MSVERGLGQQECNAKHVYLFPCGHVGTGAGVRCVYFPLPLLECNKMQVHKGPPEEERLAACFLLLLKKAGEKKPESSESALASLGGTAGREDLCVCVPGLHPKDPHLDTLPISWLLTQTLWVQENALWVVSGPSAPRLAPFRAE